MKVVKVKEPTTEQILEFLKKGTFQVIDMKICHGRPQSPNWYIQPFHVRIDIALVMNGLGLFMHSTWNILKTDGIDLYGIGIASEDYTEVPFKNASINMWITVLKRMGAVRLAEVDARYLAALLATRRAAEDLVSRKMSGIDRNGVLVDRLHKFLVQNSISTNPEMLRTLMAQDPHKLEAIAGFVRRNKAHLARAGDDDIADAVRLASVDEVMKA